LKPFTKLLELEVKGVLLNAPNTEEVSTGRRGVRPVSIQPVQQVSDLHWTLIVWAPDAPVLTL
jgi:hypothetical protein